ncbi:mitochondrial carrier [Serendipita vermifera]|nr:mitochondrial carrier [Serendipita vermifera]
MNTYQHLISGGVSGFASAVVLQPFDLVKTRLQQDNSYRNATKTGKPLTIAGVFTKIWREEGKLALWRGTGATLARNVPGVALYYTSLQQVRYTFGSIFPWAVASTKQTRTKSGRVTTLPVLSHGGNMAAGALTRTAIGLILNPLTIVKARFESNYYSYKSIPQAVVSLAREGPRMLFQGFTATALRDAPYAGIFLVVYEGCKQHLGNVIAPNSVFGPTITHTLSGAAGGTIATLVTHPFDAIKTKMQVRKEDRYKTLGRTIKAILQERGMMGMLDGVSLRLSRKVLSSMLSWTIYEGSLLLLRRQSVP